jgi:ABC-type multidrug transport system fused ATPase/permease subunit
MLVIVKMTSVERVNQYMEIKKESLYTGSIKPPKNWPDIGAIEFDRVTFACDSISPPVLKNLTFKIKGKEKVGVVGRTGSGKSSIFEALLCTGQQDGILLIDGIQITNLSLCDLRSRLAVIPVSSKNIKNKYNLIIIKFLFEARASLVHRDVEI